MGHVPAAAERACAFLLMAVLIREVGTAYMLACKNLKEQKHLLLYLTDFIYLLTFLSCYCYLNFLCYLLVSSLFSVCKRALIHCQGV